MAADGNGFGALGVALAPRATRNGRRVALVEEGGGMRGAFGAGVQAGFAEAGLPFDAFDALYGSSAGALNLTYWVSRIPGIGTRVYLEDLLSVDPQPFFLHRSSWDLLTRLARGLPGLSIAAVGHAMSVTRPIDGAAVRSHHAPILIPLTRSGDLRTAMVDVRFLAAEDLMPTLLAGATIPVLADPADHLGEEVFDGAFVSPLPVQQAIADGFTDALATLRRPPPGVSVTVLAPDA